ncbi:MAG: hypothetical protein CBB66_00260 [bacterium TMED6]|nr:MAG: hypothetical protein CBB66_00260 [bacterium TMED6]
MKHYIDDSLKSFSDRIFLSYKNKKISFEEFYHNVTSKSRALLRLDLSSNNFVGIFLSNPIDILEVYFACIQIDVIPVIFPYDINSKELQVIIKNHKIDFIITEWLQKNQIKNIKDSSFFYIQELSSSFGGCGVTEFNDSIKDTNSIQSMHLTSGSTGTPKLVKLTFNNFINSVLQWDNEINFLDSDRYVQCLPLNHIAGLSIIIRSQIKGFETILMNRFNASKVNFEIDNGATLISLIPSMLKRLIDDRAGKSFPNSLRGIILGGDGCSTRLMKYALKNNLPIYKTYGMTETCSGVTGFWIHQFPNMLDSVGKRFIKNKISILDSRVLISGPSVSPYEFNNEQNNLQTSDLGEINSNFLFLNGRCDDIVISGGENISLSKIKNILYKHDEISEVYLDTKHDDNFGTLISAFIEVSNDNLGVKEIKKYLLTFLSKNQCPKIIQIVDKIHHD